MSEDKVDHFTFYHEWSGHKQHQLNLNKKSIIYLAGDSSLDNKYWILRQQTGEALNGYENIIHPPQMVKDISYWMNYHLQDKNAACINASIEATTLSDRKDQLLPQDLFIQQNITSRDTLIVSIGGNDIVLKPSFKTIVKLLWNTKISKIENIQKGTAYGLGNFHQIFNQQITSYINQLITINKPRQILICSLYYPSKTNEPSWANYSLNKLGYDKDPQKIEALIQYTFQQCIKNIKIEGVDVKYVPLYEVLDSGDQNDYVERVEPSVQGGSKMAKMFMSQINLD